MFDGLSAEVKGLSLVSFFVSIGFGVQAPASPVFVQELGAGPMVLGWTIGALAFARMISAYPFGRLVGSWGERRTLSGGLALLAITSVAAGLSQTGWQLILFRGLSGIGSAAFSVAAMSLLLRASAPDMRGRSVGLLMGAMNLGLVAGPAIGGALLVFPVRWVFYLYGILVALAGLYAMRIMTPDHSGTHAANQARRESMGVWTTLKTSSAFRAIITVNFSLGWVVYGVRSSLLPLFLLSILHADAKWIGIGMALCALLQVVVLPYAGKLADVWGRRPMMIIGGLLVAVSIVVLLAWAHLVSYMLCMAIMGVGGAMCATASSAALGDITRGSGGTVVAFSQMASDFGMVVGPLAAGALAEDYSFTSALIISVGIAVVAIAMSVLMPKMIAKAETPPPAST